MEKVYDALVVGAGMAGLTAAAYLSREGQRVLVCERSNEPGGLVSDYDLDGFHFDAGLRAVENSGVIRPMLRDLGIDLEFLPNPVSIRIGEKSVKLGQDGLEEYGSLLKSLFPNERDAIDAILIEIRRVMDIMDVLYGIDNPLFVNVKGDSQYLLKTLLPWLMRYQVNMRKMKKYKQPIERHLSRFTGNQALIDMIAQHFFRNTPSFFALSYFGLYLDYMYPKGGTGSLSRAMAEYVRLHGGEIACQTTIDRFDWNNCTVETQDGRSFRYRKLIWAADMKALYRAAGSMSAGNDRAEKQAALVERGRGGDSVLSVFLALDLAPDVIADALGAHCFYTPETSGLTTIGVDTWRQAEGRQALEEWLRLYFERTTFEISCPAVRQAELAPEGKAGLIVSTLFSVDLARKIEKDGWYPEFKALSIEWILQQLEKAVPGIGGRVSNSSCSTPLTIERTTGNSDGAITGWAFGGVMPAEHRFQKIRESVVTPFPNTFQAGQWSFSPSGLPVSIMTGKLAADAALKEIRRGKS